jgi:ATP-binding cassette subfamily B (MDR/TAP) protein 1
VENGGIARTESKTLINHYTLYFLYLALGALVTWFISTAGFAHTGARITRRIKGDFFSSVLRQNMAVFDQGTGNMVTQLTVDANVIQEGISQKLSLTISAIGTLVATYAVSFALNWKISFMLTWSFFLSLAFLYGGNKIAVRYSKISSEANSSGISIIEEALGSIRSTTALGLQGFIAKTYDEYLNTAEKAGTVLKTLMGTMVGITVGTGYLNVALALWQGSIFLVDGTVSFMAVVAITLITKTAAFCVLGVGQNAEAFTSAISASGRVFRIISRESPIDPMSDRGLTPGLVHGTIELQNVKHVYPSRPGFVVAHDLSLVLPAGKTTAIVGPSGSGKSSVAQLIMRFYDPIRGDVLLDGHSLRDLNLKWLRRQIRFVNQEPFLFDTTVVENIEHGFVGTRLEGISPQEKMQRVEHAARIACAHDFIQGLPGGYHTRVGSRGSQLSGGQKQRIAIARAIVADPQILILDEATSALDTSTEAAVQGALNGTSTSRTTIIIAHRLSTIRDADNIIVIKDGRVVESGTHSSLMACRGAYFDLVEAQRSARDETDEEQISDNDAATDHFSMSSSDDKKEKPATIETYDYASLPPASNPNEKETSYSLLAMIRFVLGLNAKERHLILMGLLCSIIAGFEEPLSAILFGKAIVAISKPISLASEIRSESNFYALMFFLLAVVMILVFCIQGSVFAFCSERLVHRALNLALGKLLQREIAFFDQKENSASALTSFLSTEAADLAGMSGGTLGTILIAVSTLVSAFIVGLIFGWKLGLVCSSVIPVLIGCGFLAVWSVGEFEKQNERFTRASAAYAGEAISAIQTIAALTREFEVVQYYENSLTESSTENLKSHLRASFMFALARTGLYCCMGLGFWYGGTLILSHEYSLFQFTVVYMTVIMSAYSAGIIFSFSPNIGKAKRSAYGLKKLLDSTSTIDPESPAGRDPGTPQGNIDFRNVSFSYPTRPERPALQNISLSIPPGTHIALVGGTGSGKSTIVSLLERFYDPNGGCIFLDGQPISSFNLKKYRRCIGLVNQEPTMINGSIRMNLLAGIDEEVTDVAIQNACKQANIYDFITSLP